MTATAIAVVGAGHCDRGEEATAEAVGGAIARAGALLVCGGLGGVMAAACRGASAAAGTTLGILPGEDRADANQWVDVAVPTGLGEARNALVVRASDAVIAIGGAYGTLSEVALALKTGRPVIGLDTWELRRGGEIDGGIQPAPDAGRAVELALEAAGPR